jgi:hypothetical protein
MPVLSDCWEDFSQLQVFLQIMFVNNKSNHVGVGQNFGRKLYLSDEILKTICERFVVG